jgi:hypothetical protein
MSLTILHQTLQSALQALSTESSAAALAGVRELRPFLTLRSLDEIVEVPNLAQLLTDADLYHGVARALGLPPSSGRDIFGRETRADRLLPTVTEGPYGPPPPVADDRSMDLNLGRLPLALGELGSKVTRDWRASNLRRLSPRGPLQPCQIWERRETLLTAGRPVILEMSALIQEEDAKGSLFHGEVRLQVRDLQGRLKKETASEIFEDAFFQRLEPGYFQRKGPWGDCFLGQSDDDRPAWRSWVVRANIALLLVSAPFSRKDVRNWVHFIHRSQWTFRAFSILLSRSLQRLRP